MHRHVVTIARFTLRKQSDSLPLVVIAVIGLVGPAVSSFADRITESARIQSSFFAAGARLASVFMLALYITSSRCAIQ
jgi:hypothetical protein